MLTCVIVKLNQMKQGAVSKYRQVNIIEQSPETKVQGLEYKTQAALPMSGDIEITP